jgi:hypothetical protein
MTTLDVLLIEGHPGEGAADAARLEAAGHRVHRCWDEPAPAGAADRIALRDRYLCNGVTRHACPLDGGVDVALLVRGSVGSQPTVRESALTCALRAGVPVVEDGPALLDPYAPWVTRATGDLAAVCEDTASHAFDALRSEIAARIRRLILAAEADPDAIRISIQTDGSVLAVRLHGPGIDSGVEQALCVRAFDAVRAWHRDFERVDVAYDADDRSGPSTLEASCPPGES